MALFSFSKWLACALVLLLGPSLIRTSYALKCHHCDQECFPRECPDENFYRAFGFPANKVVDVACIISRDEGDSDNDSDQYCTPFGKRWASLLGGQDKCGKLVWNKDLSELSSKELDQERTMYAQMFQVFHEVERLQNASQEVPRDLKLKYGLILAIDTSWTLSHNQHQKGKSRTSGGNDKKLETCVCKKDECNSKKAFDQSRAVSVFEFRNGANIIILAAFACLRLVYGF